MIFLIEDERIRPCERVDFRISRSRWRCPSGLSCVAAPEFSVATGTFARMAGYAFLTMVERKVRWLQTKADAMANVLEEG